MSLCGDGVLVTSGGGNPNFLDRSTTAASSELVLRVRWAGGGLGERSITDAPRFERPGRVYCCTELRLRVDCDGPGLGVSARDMRGLKSSIPEGPAYALNSSNTEGDLRTSKISSVAGRSSGLSASRRCRDL